jgi:hypothetical protein
MQQRPVPPPPAAARASQNGRPRPSAQHRGGAATGKADPPPRGDNLRSSAADRHAGDPGLRRSHLSDGPSSFTCSASMGEGELAEVTRDVAARIIQLHWRALRQHRQRLGLRVEACDAHESASCLPQPQRDASPPLTQAPPKARRHRSPGRGQALCRSDGALLLGREPALPRNTHASLAVPQLASPPWSQPASSSGLSCGGTVAPLAASGTPDSSSRDSAEAPSQRLLAELTAGTGLPEFPARLSSDKPSSCCSGAPSRQGSLDLQPQVSQQNGGSNDSLTIKTSLRRDQAPRSSQPMVPHPPEDRLEQLKHLSSKPVGLTRLRRSFDGRRASWPAALMQQQFCAAPVQQCALTAAPIPPAARSDAAGLPGGLSPAKGSPCSEPVPRTATSQQQQGQQQAPDEVVSQPPALPQAAPLLGQPDAQPPLSAPANSAAEKLLSLLGYLDSVEREAEHEATTAAASSARNAAQHKAQQSKPRVSLLASPLKTAVATGQSSNPGPCQGHTDIGAGGHPAASLAESVFGGVRARLQRMEAELAARDAALARARADADSLGRAHAEQLEAARAQSAEVAAAVRVECEEAAARQLTFIDRLLEDKDQLKSALVAAEDAARATHEKHAAVVAALKQGWAAELRRQRDAWAASEQAKREAWSEAKAAEIKTLTVKVAGLVGWDGRWGRRVEAAGGCRGSRVAGPSSKAGQLSQHPGSGGGGAAADCAPPRRDCCRPGAGSC